MLGTQPRREPDWDPADTRSPVPQWAQDMGKWFHRTTPERRRALVALLESLERLARTVTTPTVTVNKSDPDGPAAHEPDYLRVCDGCGDRTFFLTYRDGKRLCAACG